MEKIQLVSKTIWNHILLSTEMLNEAYDIMLEKCEDKKLKIVVQAQYTGCTRQSRVNSKASAYNIFAWIAERMDKGISNIRLTIFEDIVCQSQEVQAFD